MDEIQVIEAVAVEETTAIAAYSNLSVIEAFLASLDLKPRSIDTYRKAVGYFFSWISEEGITHPKRTDVIRYKKDLTGKYSVTTVSSYLTAIRRFFKYLNAEGMYPNICAEIQNPRSRAGHRKDALSLEQAKKVLGTMKRDTLAQKRDYAIVSLLLHTGLRTCEVERANYEDLRSNLGTPVLNVWGKGRDSADEYVKVTPTVLEAIKDYLKTREAADGKLKDTDPLFASVSRRDYGGRITTRSVSRICKQALRAAGYDDPKLTAHSLRHTAVSIPLQAGVEIREVQKMARHSSPLTTEVYAHDIRRLENAPEDKIEELLAG